MSSPEPAADAAERAARLAEALRAVGLRVDVEADGAVAVLVGARGSQPIDWAGMRAEVVRLAQTHGFRSVAVDIDPTTGG